MVDFRLTRDVPGHRLICAICIEWVDFSELAVDSDGTTWDMCKPCAELEATAVVFALMAGRKVRSLAMDP